MDVSAKQVIDFTELLEYFSIASKRQLQALCHRLHQTLVHLFASIAYNLLYNRQLSLTSAQRSQLRVHKRHLKTLANKRTSVTRKQRLLRQRGHLLLGPMVGPTLNHIQQQQQQRRPTDKNDNDERHRHTEKSLPKTNTGAK